MIQPNQSVDRFAADIGAMTPAQSFEALSEVVAQFGFSGVHYVRWGTSRTGKLALVEQSTLPRDWLEFYERNELFRYDPIVFADRERVSIWSDLSTPDFLGDNRSTPCVQQLAADWGVGSGVTVPVANRFGVNSGFGLVNMPDRSDAELRSDWEAQKRHLEPYLAAYDASCAISDLAVDQIALSMREIEVLSLFAEGFSTKSAAAQMGNSWHTAEKQIKSAKRKLGAQTLTQAVVRAIILGIIWLLVSWCLPRHRIAVFR